MSKLYDELTSYENIHKAYIDARRCKRYRSSILRFGCELEKRLGEIEKELLSRSYKHGGYREFVVSDSKKRLIKAAPFRDRVTHHALCNAIEPILDKTFIFDSYACRKGKGTHAAVRRLEKFIRSARSDAKRKGFACSIFCLKCDISKYFNSIDQDILLKILGRSITDGDVTRLMTEIVKSSPQGIPIGNLTSQLFANTYLNELDHYVKRVLKEKYYIRYMDDFLILGEDKKHLHEIKEEIRLFLDKKLELSLHPKKASVFPVNKGVDFLGYVLKDGKRKLRKTTVKRFLKKRRRYKAMIKSGKVRPDIIKDSDASWRGYCKFGNAYRLMKRLTP